jgi:hypothetical protein
MKIDGKLFIVLITVLAFTPGACAISVSGGSSVSTTGSAQGTLIANDEGVTGYSESVGGVNGIDTYMLQDRAGKFAMVVKYVNSHDPVIFRCTLRPNKDYATNGVIPKESTLTATIDELDATHANIIMAGVEAGQLPYDANNKPVVPYMVASAVSVSSSSWNGMLVGYTSSATVTDKWLKKEATTNAQADFAKGDTIQFASGALSSSISQPYLSESAILVEGGRLTGYLDNAKANANPTSASSSHFIDYAEGSNIMVGTAAFQFLGDYAPPTPGSGNIFPYFGGKVAGTISTVEDGNIFLYSDSSNIDRSQAKSSSDIKAVGTTIDVQSEAADGAKIDNRPQMFHKKLAADIVSESSSKKFGVKPTIYEGLALMALQSNAVAPGVSHIGVGIWDDDGTWTVGAVQGDGSSNTPEEAYNGGWYKTKLTWEQAESYLAGGFKDVRPNVNPDWNSPILKTPDDAKKYGGGAGNGLYDTIKIIKVINTPSAPAAISKMADFWKRGYQLVTSDCLTATIDTLKAYGYPAPDRGNRWSYAGILGSLGTFYMNNEPKMYYNKILEKEYIWNTAAVPGYYAPVKVSGDVPIPAFFLNSYIGTYNVQAIARFLALL